LLEGALRSGFLEHGRVHLPHTGRVFLGSFQLLLSRLIHPDASVSWLSEGVLGAWEGRLVGLVVGVHKGRGLRMNNGLQALDLLPKVVDLLVSVELINLDCLVKLREPFDLLEDLLRTLLLANKTLKDVKISLSQTLTLFLLLSFREVCQFFQDSFESCAFGFCVLTPLVY